MSFKFSRVTSKRDVKAFYALPFRIYDNYPNWAPPFRFQIEQIFNPDKNEFFQTGECERYLVLNGDKVVGRFAVMNQPQKDDVLDPTMGGLGFIEMEDDAGLAQAIVDFAKDWHRKRGYNAMRGPINFGENDNFWGLLVENYEEPPIYGMFYHPPYYKKLLEQTGAEKLDDHWSYKRRFDDPIPERMERIVDRIESKPEVELRTIDRNNLYRDAEFIREIYNQAWSSQDIDEREQEFTELGTDTVRKMVDDLKRVMIPESVLLALVNGEPASFVASIPDLNEVSRETNGKLHLWHMPKMMRFKKRARHLRTIAFGTVPKYRKMGLEALTFVRGIQYVHAAAPNLDYLEGAWVSEKNWLMQRSLEALGCHHHKTHRTYFWEF